HHRLSFFAYAFFFLCSRSLRDLHSFPTRRSSDLFCSQTTVSVVRSKAARRRLVLTNSRPAFALAAIPRTPSAGRPSGDVQVGMRSEEHTSELQSPYDLVCRLLLEKKKKKR